MQLFPHLITALLAGAIAASPASAATHPTFEDFAYRFDKKYSSTADQLARKAIYQSNLQIIDKLNARSPSAHFAVNKFADLTEDEFRSSYLLNNDLLLAKLQHRTRSTHIQRPPILVPPKTKSWFGTATTPVRDQGQCGSCWAFSTVEQVESDWYLAGKSSSPEELSVQQLIDCDNTGAFGCAGTYAGGGSGYRFIAKNGGLASEKSYPYTSGKTGSTGTCKKGIANSGGGIQNFSYAIKPCDLPWDDCNNQDEDGLLAYVAERGPLAICVNANNWQFYKSGVLTGSSCGGHDHGSLDHCVQLVGYGNYNPSKGVAGSGMEDGAYWIVRNSWATTWGEAGLINLQMGNNTCGLADVPSHAIL